MEAKDNKKEIKTSWVVFGFVVFALVIILFNSFTIIPSGNRGVVFSKATGIQDKVLNEGFHFKKPFIDDITYVNVKTVKFERVLSSTSSDQQQVTVNVGVNYRVIENKAHKLYQEIGLDYDLVILKPAIEDSVKTAMAKYRAEDLIIKREEVGALALKFLEEKTSDKYLDVEKLNLIDITFSEAYNQAIEDKVVAEQEAFKEKNVLEKEKIKKETLIVQAEAQKESKILNAEAQKESRILSAEGNAQAILLEKEAEAQGINLVKDALKGSEDVVEYKIAERWNGNLPQYVTGENSGLLMNMNNLAGVKSK